MPGTFVRGRSCGVYEVPVPAGHDLGERRCRGLSLTGKLDVIRMAKGSVRGHEQYVRPDRTQALGSADRGFVCTYSPGRCRRAPWME
jgi:hypothetical protein